MDKSLPLQTDILTQKLSSENIYNRIAHITKQPAPEYYNMKMVLRHTIGTRLGEEGVDLAVIQDILAHTSVATTKRYRHTTSEQMNKAMQVLNSYR